MYAPPTHQTLHIRFTCLHISSQYLHIPSSHFIALPSYYMSTQYHMNIHMPHNMSTPIYASSISNVTYNIVSFNIPNIFIDIHFSTYHTCSHICLLYHHHIISLFIHSNTYSYHHFIQFITKHSNIHLSH